MVKELAPAFSKPKVCRYRKPLAVLCERLCRNLVRREQVAKDCDRLLYALQGLPWRRSPQLTDLFARPLYGK